VTLLARNIILIHIHTCCGVGLQRRKGGGNRQSIAGFFGAARFKATMLPTVENEKLKLQEPAIPVIVWLYISYVQASSMLKSLHSDEHSADNHCTQLLDSLELYCYPIQQVFTGRSWIS
jgi:hypothetical protein